MLQIHGFKGIKSKPSGHERELGTASKELEDIDVWWWPLMDCHQGVIDGLFSFELLDGGSETAPQLPGVSQS